MTTERVCSVEGCAGKRRTKGMCARHYLAAYNAAHREEIVARKREHYAAHKDEIAAWQREHNAAHKEEYAARQRKYNAAHKEEYAAYYREYYVAHKEEHAARRQAACARRRQRVEVNMSQADRDLSVLVRKGFRENREPCAYCGTEYVEGEFHVDHDLPIARGGTDHWWNLQHSCAPCNLRKHTMTGDEFRALLESQAA